MGKRLASNCEVGILRTSDAGDGSLFEKSFVSLHNERVFCSTYFAKTDLGAIRKCEGRELAGVWTIVGVMMLNPHLMQALRSEF